MILQLLHDLRDCFMVRDTGGGAGTLNAEDPSEPSVDAVTMGSQGDEFSDPETPF